MQDPKRPIGDDSGYVPGTPLENYADGLPGLGHDPLVTPLRALLLRCGGTPKGSRFSVYRGACRETILAAFPVESMEALAEGLRSVGWVVAVGGPANGKTFVDERGLNVPRESFADVLCPSCGKALLDKLSRESRR